jgi:hypothetical protein
MTTEKLELVQAELCTVHTSIEKLVGALISAKRKCDEEESQGSPSEKKIGKFRVEIAGNERKLTDLRQSGASARRRSSPAGTWKSSRGEMKGELPRHNRSRRKSSSLPSSPLPRRRSERSTAIPLGGSRD